MKLLLTTIKSGCAGTGLDMMYLYSIVADSPMDVSIRCFEPETHYMDIYEEIAAAQHDIVYFHADEYNFVMLKRVAAMVRKALPGTAVIFGGAEVSFDTRSFMQDNQYVDYVIRGEGERVLFNFARALLKQDYDFENIAGLAWREGGEVRVNPYEAPLDPEDLPFPYERFDSGTGIVYYETMRGTSDRTAYSRHYSDARIRAVGSGRVCTEIRYFLAKEVKKVVFLDRHFNYNSERAYRIFEYIISNDNGVTSFEFSINADWLDDETMRLLAGARAGQIVLDIDLASTNPDVLSAIGRSENIYRLMYNTARLMKRGNICFEILVRAGLPFETKAMFERSFNRAYGLAEGMPVHIDMVRLGTGTALRAEAAKLGYRYASEAPYEVISTGHMKAGELLEIRRTARIVESFTGDGGFCYSIPKMLSDTGMKPYELFRGLGSYIRRSGLVGRMRKKENLARILYAYAAGLYEEFALSCRLDDLRDLIRLDLTDLIGADSARKFEKKGWSIEPKKHDATEITAAGRVTHEPAGKEPEAVREASPEPVRKEPEAVRETPEPTREAAPESVRKAASESVRKAAPESIRVAAAESIRKAAEPARKADGRSQAASFGDAEPEEQGLEFGFPS